MSTVTFAFPHRWMFSLPQHWKKKALQTYNFKRIFKGSFGSVSHTTTTKIEATRNKIPLMGLGTGLANPSVHSDPNNSKVTFPLLLRFSFFSNFRRKVLKELSNTFFYVVQLSVGYFLMLVTFTHNTWLFMAVIISHGLGFYLVTPLVIAYSEREDIGSYDHIRKDLLLVRRKRQPLIRNADI